MNVVTAPPADAQMARLVQPVQASLRHPACPAEPASVLGTAVRQRRGALRASALGALLFGTAALGVARAQWTDVPICTHAGDHDHPTMIPDGAGGAVIVWSDGRSYEGMFPAFDIYAQRIAGSGVVQWAQDGVPMCTARYSQREPGIVSDGMGGCIVAWMDPRTGNSRIYAQHLNGAGQPLWTPDGIAVSKDSSVVVRYVEVTSDGAGGAVVVWNSVTPQHAIYAQRVTVTGASWSADVPVCNLLLSQTRPHVVSDGAGGWVVVWADDRVAGTQDVYAQRLNSAGVPQWSTNGIALSSSHVASHPAVLSNGPGSVVVMWSDARTGRRQIYGQRLNSSGVPAWPADGVLISSADAQEVQPTLVRDALDGTIVIWNDGTNDGQGHSIIRSQHVNGSGVPLWASTGVVVGLGVPCCEAGPAISDLNGGAILLYSHDDGPRGQRLGASGGLGWTPAGIRLSSHDARDGSGVGGAVPDGAGGALFLTSLYFSPYFDLFAGHISSLGNVAVAPGPLPPDTGLAIAAVSANPSQGSVTAVLTVSRASVAVLRTFDLQGRSQLVQDVIPSDFIPLRVPIRGSERLPPGIYLLQLTQSGRSACRRICVLR